MSNPNLHAVLRLVRGLAVGGHGERRRTRRERRRKGPLIEQLEQRVLLSTIIWTNRGVNGGPDTDNFAATYGANAEVARAIVDRAIDDWETVIENFNYAGGGNTFTLNISATDLGGGSRGATSGIGVDPDGKPTSANIQLDDDGGGAGWYFDASTADDAEFTTLLSQFTANGSNALGGNDFYRTIVHEIGHAVGIVTGGAQAINSFLTACGTDAVDGSSTLRAFVGVRVTAVLTDNGGGHIYEGPGVASCLSGLVHPNDLMNPGRTVGFPPPTRELITDLDALILADAYGYTVRLPSTINTFYANFDSTTGVLTVNGSPGNVDDQIFIDVDGGIRVQVNGSEERFPASSVTSINVLAGEGDDFIKVSTSVGVPVTIDGGEGDDYIEGADVTIIGGPGNDTLIGSDGDDSLDGGPGDDSIVGLGGDDTLIGGDGNDTLRGGTGDNSITDGTGDDLVDYSENDVAINYTTDGDNDTVLGTAFDDVITAGAGAGPVWFEGRGGDDALTGGADNDWLDGGDGADSITPAGGHHDSVYGGPGPDRFFEQDGDLGASYYGGPDEDEIWLQGTSAPDDFELYDTWFELNQVISPMADIEIVAAWGNGGGDTFWVHDLTQSDVKVVRLSGQSGYADTVVVEGRTVADDLMVTASGSLVNVAGLRYDVDILGASAGDGDQLTIGGNDGDDTIKAASGVESTILVALSGGPGNDYLSGDATLNGGAGDDTLVGGSGNDSIIGYAGDDLLLGGGGDDTLRGHSGEDTFVGGTGDDLIDGGDDFDTILVTGTSGEDLIDINQTGPLSLEYTVNGTTETDSLVVDGGGNRTVESVKVEAGAGDDIILATWADSLGVDSAINALMIIVDGQDDFTRDRLAVLDDGTGDLVLYRKGVHDDEGSITIGPSNQEALELVFSNVEQVQTQPAADGDLVVF